MPPSIRLSTRPRSTATVAGRSASFATPVWIGSAPVQRKLIESVKEATSLAESTGAAAAGSSAGGSSGPPGGSGSTTVQPRCAGEGSRLPAASTARTSNVWAPAASPVRTLGDSQAANAAPPRRHSNAAGASVEVNWNVAVVDSTEPVGPAVMVVFGGVVSVGAGVWVGAAVAVGAGPRGGEGGPATGPGGLSAAVTRSLLPDRRQLLRSLRSRTRRPESAHANRW